MGKNIGDVRVATSGAGAAAIACLDLLVALGIQRKNIVACDSKGVIYNGRDPKLDASKQRYAIEDNGLRTLKDAIANADIFLGVSGPRVVTPEMVTSM